MLAGQVPVTAPADRAARAALTILAGPGDRVLGALLQGRPPAAVLDLIQSGPDPGGTTAADAALRAGLRRWRSRLPGLSQALDLARANRTWIRLICPGDPEWPAQLDDLGTARPCALRARGTASLALPPPGPSPSSAPGPRPATGPA
jgi:DNA processing protein